MASNPLLTSFSGIDDDSKLRDESSKVVWSTEKVKKVISAMEDGYKIQDNPFYESDIKFKKSDTVFEYTDEELNEIRKCAKDIIYFANNYCSVMTDMGYQIIKLRPYQEKVLKTYQNNRFTIFMSPRQSGKCLFYHGNIKIADKISKKEKTISIGDFYYSKINPSILGKFKVFLYKIIKYL